MLTKTVGKEYKTEHHYSWISKGVKILKWDNEIIHKSILGIINYKTSSSLNCTTTTVHVNKNVINCAKAYNVEPQHIFCNRHRKPFEILDIFYPYHQEGNLCSDCIRES